MIKAMLALFFCAFCGATFADIDVYPFESPEQEVRFRVLINEFRCPKCQNQNLSDSNAPLAKDLRALIYEQIQNGKSDAEIAHYLQERYGDFVLYNPPIKGNTLLLWFGPSIVLLGVLFMLFRGKKALVTAPNSGVLSADESAHLQRILEQQHSDTKKAKS